MLFLHPAEPELASHLRKAKFIVILLYILLNYARLQLFNFKVHHRYNWRYNAVKCCMHDYVVGSSDVIVVVVHSVYYLINFPETYSTELRLDATSQVLAKQRAGGGRRVGPRWGRDRWWRLSRAGARWTRLSTRVTKIRNPEYQ